MQPWRQESELDGWRKMISMVDEQEGCEWMMFLLVPAHPGRPGQRAVKRPCVCVNV